jgi:hypothetical protein
MTPQVNTGGQGNNIAFFPGKGDKGYKDGSVIFNDADGNEMMAIHSDKSVSILGAIFQMEDIKKALENFVSDGCKCPMKQLMTTGCSCGGK